MNNKTTDEFEIIYNELHNKYFNKLEVMRKDLKKRTILEITIWFLILNLPITGIILSALTDIRLIYIFCIVEIILILLTKKQILKFLKKDM